MTAATTPATDEQIAEMLTLMDASPAIDDRQKFAENILRSLIARIHQEREKAIRECAEVARDHAKTWGSALGTPATVIADAILALLPTPPALSQEGSSDK